MTVSALGGSQSPWEMMKQRRAAMQSMEQAVQSGDIKSAQQSLATVQQLSPTSGAGSTQGADNESGNPFRSTMKTDLSSLESAVTSGNITDAQSALTKLNSDRQSFESSDSSSQPDDDSTGFAADMKKMLEAAFKGDTAAAQESAKALQADLQSVFGTSSSAATSTTAATSSSTSSGTSLIDDLKALVAAGQGTDADATQAAAQKFVQDLEQTSGGDQQSGGVQGGHHHHHGGHHAQVVAQYEQTFSVTASASPSDGTAATDPTSSVAT